MISFKPFKSTYLFLFVLLIFQLISYAQSSELKVETAAARTDLYVNLLKGKNIAVVANQTSVIFKEIYKKKQEARHLVDSLLMLGVEVKKVFAPEHGFRGKADAGEVVKDGFDTKTGPSI